MNVAPLRHVQAEGKDHRPGSIQRTARLHERAVKAMSETPVKARRTRGKSKAKRAEVVVTQMHPAYVMANALGIPREHVQIIKDGPRWECVVWNHPAPWPGSDSEQ